MNTKRTKTGSTKKLSGFKPKQILVPVDFSEATPALLGFAKDLAEQTGARLTLVHVVEPIHADWKMDTTDLQMERHAQAKRLMQALVDEEFGAGKVASEVRSGHPVEVITAFAKQVKADLIVIATHGRTGLKRVLLGSVAERVVRHASCPVLIAR